MTNSLQHDTRPEALVGVRHYQINHYATQLDEADNLYADGRISAGRYQQRRRELWQVVDRFEIRVEVEALIAQRRDGGIR